MSCLNYLISIIHIERDLLNNIESENIWKIFSSTKCRKIALIY